MKYYYTVSAFSEIGHKLSRFIGKCMDVSHQAELFAEKYGAESYIESPIGYAGGVAMLCFDTEPDANLWRKVELADGIAYEVNVTESVQESIAKNIKDGNTDTTDLEPAVAIETERQLLPIVSEFALLDILTPRLQHDGKGKIKPVALSETPAMFEYRDNYYICLTYPTDAEVEAITESVYFRRKMAFVNKA